MRRYLRQVWSARYFWTHLSLSDLRTRWRRSFFGVFWAILQPVGLTLLLSAVLSRLLDRPLVPYALHIFSGMIIWDFLSSTAVHSTQAFILADAYIKQCRLPLAIYPLRHVLGNIIVLALAGIPLALVALFALRPAGTSPLAALAVFPVLVLIAWPLGTLLAYAGVRFRDLPHALGLALQALWFVSPVYFEESLFRRGGLAALVDYNPVYHILQLVRAPLLEGHWPTTANLLFCLGTAAVLSVAAAAIGSRSERRVIFYL